MTTAPVAIDELHSVAFAAPEPSTQTMPIPSPQPAALDTHRTTYAAESFGLGVFVGVIVALAGILLLFKTEQIHDANQCRNRLMTATSHNTDAIVVRHREPSGPPPPVAATAPTK